MTHESTRKRRGGRRISKVWAIVLGQLLGSLLTMVSFAAVSPALAQSPFPSAPREGPIETDRPGNGNAATTVPQWHFQIETSVNYALDGGSSSRAHAVSFPTALRLGVTPFLELRAGTAVVGIQTPADDQVASPTDTVAGTKLQALVNDGSMPNLALVADVFFPTGRGAFTSGVVVPDIRLAASWALPAGFGLLTNAGADVPEDVDGRFARFVYVVNLNYAPPIADGRFTVFVEGFGRVPPGAREPVLQIDAGASFLIRPNLQVDLFSQHGFTDQSPDHQVSLGFSARLGRSVEGRRD